MAVIVATTVPTDQPTGTMIEFFLLRGLPDFPDEIAELMAANGLTGVRESLRDTPLVHLLELWFPWLSFCLQPLEKQPAVVFRPIDRNGLGEPVEISGMAVAKFVDNFRRGRYPRLVARKRRWRWLAV